MIQGRAEIGSGDDSQARHAGTRIVVSFEISSNQVRSSGVGSVHKLGFRLQSCDRSVFAGARIEFAQPRRRGTPSSSEGQERTVGTRPRCCSARGRAHTRLRPATFPPRALRVSHRSLCLLIEQTTSPGSTATPEPREGRDADAPSPGRRDRRRGRESLAAKRGGNDRGGVPGSACARPRPVGGSAHQHPDAVCWRCERNSLEDPHDRVVGATQTDLAAARDRPAASLVRGAGLTA